MPESRVLQMPPQKLLRRERWNMIPMPGATTMGIITGKNTTATIITEKNMNAAIITGKVLTAALRRGTTAAAAIMGSKHLQGPQMNLLLDLFLTFAKIGLFTFGGGYALIALIENTCVEKKQWITQDEMMNVTVIAESTPGPIAINCATFVGYKQKGFAGALAATVGIILPSFCIIYAISRFLDHFLEITWIAHAFQGIKIAVGILILDAAMKMLRKMQKGPMPRAFMACAFTAMLLANLLSVRISSIILMLAAGLISLILFLMKNPAAKGGGGK